VTKGIESKALMRMSEAIEDVFNGTYNNIAVLSGSNHAEKVCRKIPTVVTSAAKNIETAENVDYFYE
jgi:glycerol-3-phosphate dehydrogenase (NAD(P)+)